MQLTPEQEVMVRDGTPAQATAMRILLALGKIYEADRLLPITSAHIAGASFKTVGEAGRAFIEEFSRTAGVKVRTTVNPIGMDENSWRDVGIPEEFAAQQRRILEAYRRMGVEESWSCTPYLIGNRPGRGEHVAWAESSAVIVANSLLGARTNREGGPSALAAAVTGWTPNYGLHLEGGRRATVQVEVEGEVRGYEYGLLGLHMGKVLGEGIPYLRGVRPTADEAKALAAALGAVSEVAMFHIEDQTPEWREAEPGGLERISVTRRELVAARDAYTNTEDVDLIVFGCPQVSGPELAEISDLLSQTNPGKEVWVFTSRRVASENPEVVKSIRAHGGRVILDTCPEVTPLELFARASGTPSGKGAVYLPTLCRQRVLLDEAANLVRRFR